MCVDHFRSAEIWMPVGVLFDMLENGAPESIVEVQSGFGGEDVALLRVEAHLPTGLPIPQGS